MSQPDFIRMAQVSDYSNHHQVYRHLKFIGKCNYTKLPSQYLCGNKSLQKHFLLLLFLALQSLADHKPLPQLPSAVLGPASYVYNSLHLQIIDHAGLSPLFPSRFQLQKVLKTHIFYWVGLSASRPTPKLEDQGIPFRLGSSP